MQQLSIRADVDVARSVEDEIGPAEGAIGSCRLVPDRDVRRDVTVHQPLEQPDRAINGVTRQPPRPKIEAILDTLDHSLGDGNLGYTIGACAFSVRFNRSLNESFATQSLQTRQTLRDRTLAQFSQCRAVALQRVRTGPRLKRVAHTAETRRDLLHALKRRQNRYRRSNSPIAINQSCTEQSGGNDCRSVLLLHSK